MYHIEELSSSERTVDMEHRMSIEGAVYFTRQSVRLACTWPPPKQATKWEIAKADAAWLLSLLSAIGLLIPLVMSIYEYRKNSIILTQSTTFTFGFCDLIVKTLICRINRKKFQILIDEMMEFIKNAEPHEKRILQKYVDRCWPFHVFITILNYFGTICVVVSPFFFPHQSMPTHAVYPFSIDSPIAMSLVYIHQSVAGMQNSSGVTIDCQVAMMMWFAGARLEILAREIGDVSAVKDFRFLVKKHGEILSYARQVSGTMCYIALASTCLCGIGTIMSSLQLVGNQPFIDKIQFVPVVFICLINLLICALPAENMIRVCDLIGTAVYNISWFDMSPKSMKDIVIIIKSSQRPVLVTVGGFLPALSMRFYASFLSGAFSYFTTARLVLMSDRED